MKQIQQWLEELEEPYKTQAFENTQEDRLTLVTDTLSNAIQKAFTWSETPQGRNYWGEIHDKISSLEPKPYTKFKKNVKVRPIGEILREKGTATIEELRTATGIDILTLERELQQLQIWGSVKFKNNKWHYTQKPKKEYGI